MIRPVSQVRPAMGSGFPTLLHKELMRFWKVGTQTIAAPVVTALLYLLIFSHVLEDRVQVYGSLSYTAFLVPGLIMLTLLTQSTQNASFGIYFPKFIGSIYELMSAPVSYVEIVIGYVGAAATKSLILGVIILLTARLFVDYEIQHPLMMALFLVLTAVTFCLFGFIIGIWADGWEKLQIVPALIVTPLAFLGGSFYSIEMLPPLWQKITLFNPVVYLISGFRWSFYGVADVNVGISLAAITGFLALCLVAVWWIFRTGWKLKS